MLSSEGDRKKRNKKEERTPVPAAIIVTQRAGKELFTKDVLPRLLGTGTTSARWRHTPQRAEHIPHKERPVGSGGLKIGAQECARALQGSKVSPASGRGNNNSKKKPTGEELTSSSKRKKKRHALRAPPHRAREPNSHRLGPDRLGLKTSASMLSDKLGR